MKGELLLAGFLLLVVGVYPAGVATPAFDLDLQVANRASIIITVTFEPVPQGFNWVSLEAS